MATEQQRGEEVNIIIKRKRRKNKHKGRRFRGFLMGGTGNERKGMLKEGQ
jgi:hypothetical protein